MGGVSNPDMKTKTKEEFRDKIKQALEEGDTEKFSQVFTDYMSSIEQTVMSEAKGAISIKDSDILQTRGVRQLTSSEKEFYQKTIEAMQAAPNSINSLDVVMPETIINSVFEDLKAEHELLSIIDFKNVTGLTRILVNTNTRQLAQWGPLNSEIAKELESGFKDIQLGQNKLTAFMLVSQDMLNLGPVWLDRYVREVMYEALAFGLEYGMINGTGKNMPIGMVKDLNGAVVDGVYPDKTAIKVTTLDPISYGQLLSKLSKTEKGNPRVVKNVIMIVNPTDYLTKIMPATTIRAADGTYVNNVLPYPTKIVQSTEVSEGKAVIGMSDKYFMGMGLVKDGKIEYSDEYKFLEDYRTYKIRFLGHGQAKDNNAFIVADISELKPAIHKVEVVQETPQA
jgi:HK97 family phage major capsid protein